MGQIRIERVTKSCINGVSTSYVAYFGPRFIVARHDERTALKQARVILANEARRRRAARKAGALPFSDNATAG